MKFRRVGWIDLRKREDGKTEADREDAEEPTHSVRSEQPEVGGTLGEAGGGGLLDNPEGLRD